MAKANKARNASPAMIQCARPFSARRETRNSASITTARTAACTPVNKAATRGWVPKAAYTIDSTSTTSAPGITNNSPVITPPIVPWVRQPIQVASCIASGPGNNMQNDRAER